MNSDEFIADLHIHSKFSRATARDLDLEHLYMWAQKKGITVVGTGDFTHPAWYSQIIEKLEPAEPGLYRLRSEIARVLDERVPPPCRAPVRFLLSCEISNIYKKNDRTRKNHNLVFFPDLESAGRFNARLDSIGNIQSDGRPILGLDARNLLEVVLETSIEGFLVPAHIWTPWFSMLGSKSGFDSISECFGDLSPYIFAAETGLSSDPAMNWRVADLDNITLISNSDAHSPSKLGREANLFRTELSYHAMRSAMEHGDEDRFSGTFEFYPEEGKYHVDGHRKCEICFTPTQTESHGGICPVCGKPLTLGVLHRVEKLATRPEGIRPPRSFPFHRLIPLDNLLAEIFRVGSQSKKVLATYEALLSKLGSEFKILHHLAMDKIDTAGIPLLGEAIMRMRDNRVTFSPGYDGLFGKIHIFSDQERARLRGQPSLFASAERPFAPVNPDDRSDYPKNKSSFHSDATIESVEPIDGLNPEQQDAVENDLGHLMIVAGPGTGKTRTLTCKIARLIESGADGQRMLAVTFTNKAAGEMKARLLALLGNPHAMPFIGTFHSLGYRILTSSTPDKKLCVIDDASRKLVAGDALTLNGQKNKSQQIHVDEFLRWIVDAKQKMITRRDSLETVCPQDRLKEFTNCYRIYDKLLRIQNLIDFEDLIYRSLQLLENDQTVGGRYRNRFSHIFVDEYQDINAGQYNLIKMLAGEDSHVCVIGDPDQSIYGFRGSDVDCFQWYIKDFPEARTVFLKRNYRSTQTILDVSAQVIRHNPDLLESGHRRAVFSNIHGEKIIYVWEVPTENAEAVAIGKTIENMIGGTGFFSLDSGAVDGIEERSALGFNDFAVLVRTRNQLEPIRRFLEKAGIPCQVVERKTVLDHPGIKKLIAIFKLMHDMGVFSDLNAAIEGFKPNISVKTADTLKIWAYQNNWSLAQALVHARRLPVPRMKLSLQQRLFEFIREVDEFKRTLEGAPIPERLDSILEKTKLGSAFIEDRTFENGCHRLREIGMEHPNDPEAFIAALALSGDTDIYDHRAEKVSLITMHAAKGLEFSVVFIAGCEDGWIPYRSSGRPTDVEEERRLFYVALTRAKKHLFLTRAKVRRINGVKTERQLSPFVKDIENRYKQIAEKYARKADNPAQEQLLLF